MNNEQEILETLKGGSKKAFETIYHKYAGRLYNFVMTISHGNRFMAEEVVQSTFVKLWEVHEQIDPEKPILSYLSVIAKNNLLNKYQRQTIEYLHHKLISQNESHHDNLTEKEINRKWMEYFLDELIAQLPPSRRTIFILKKKKDLSTKQIAEIMNISVSTVETQLSLATKFIRREFEKNYDKLFLLCMIYTLI